MARKKTTRKTTKKPAKKPAGGRGRAAKAARARTPREPAASGVKLLSGGNPQIPKGDGDAPVRAYLDAMPGWKRDVGERLDTIIARAVPGVRRAVRWNSPFYGTDANGWFLSFHCITRYVKVAFFNGASLNPPPPVPSKHEATRYFHVHEGEEIDEALFADWVKQAAAAPGWDGFNR